MAKYEKSIQEATNIFNDLLKDQVFTDVVERIMGIDDSGRVVKVGSGTNHNHNNGVFKANEFVEGFQLTDVKDDILLVAA